MRIQKIIFIIFMLLLSSCARVPVKPPVAKLPVPPVTTDIYPGKVPPARRSNVYHEVGPGETLWRISKIYDVSMHSVAKANRLKQYSKLETGQKLLVPNAAPARPVISLYKNKKWRYIIIHHTATDAGNALQINKAHLNRGFWNGLGYHFLIDNGTMGKRDGQIEVAPRWLKQKKGAHCKANGMNNCGIGVGIVGNLSEKYISKEQFDSLVYLVNLLREYYKIPLSNIIGHGRVKGAATECPGKHFPWQRFKQALKSSK